MTTIGENIRRLRIEAGLTQTELAERLNIGPSKSRISEWESGKYEPRLETLPCIADALGVSMARLLGEAPPEAPPSPPPAAPGLRAFLELVPERQAVRILWAIGSNPIIATIAGPFVRAEVSRDGFEDLMAAVGDWPVRRVETETGPAGKPYLCVTLTREPEEKEREDT